ncbi:hypothetical protein KIL84_009883 [Mauremys mutica]|uniref:Uncharacterized protein n=1 Tax=Mauremys mutica TaxID=74926 RepID=A0A9D4B6K8_9SAUR|nr:hypothetical protein KIL84_009883 [Mauremys mutica]
MVYRQMRGRKIDVNFAIARGRAQGEGVISAFMQSGQAAARAPSPAGTTWLWLKCLRTSWPQSSPARRHVLGQLPGSDGTTPCRRLNVGSGALLGPFRERNLASDAMPSAFPGLSATVRSALGPAQTHTLHAPASQYFTSARRECKAPGA